ncbi:PepSY domain-containing protein [Cribrihabitans marinus]|uniref:PepSY domain-containing protein n=1 Tax=Cribrihabitans marinus TaxID=1227549 RepID=UPI0015A65A90|nr:PepSY domain-containing protein [Cribrihabitans marinus]GGH23415.1 hypothetical protein GCM10010973_09290 [Cribrihabitans marinus]
MSHVISFSYRSTGHPALRAQYDKEIEMMRKIFMLTTAMALATSLEAQSQTFNDQVVDGLAAQGFRATEIKTGPTQTKVEAVRGQTKLEVIYDRATGRILKQETERLAGTGGNIGLEVSQEDRDFTDRSGGRRDDDEDHDDDDDRDRDRDRDREDDRGKDHDDDRNDDRNDDRDDDHDDDRDDDREDNSGSGSDDD